MTANSTSAKLVRKPNPDFPLLPHESGRWAKKVRGKLHYFGKSANHPQGHAALDLPIDSGAYEFEFVTGGTSCRTTGH